MESSKTNILYVKSLVGRRCFVEFYDRSFKEQWRLCATRNTEGFSDDRYKLWELGFEHPANPEITQWVRLDAVKVLTESSLPPMPDRVLNQGVNSEDCCV